MTLKEFLGGLGLEHYYDKLIAEEVNTVAELRTLKDEHLKELGFKIGARGRILDELASRVGTPEISPSSAGPGVGTPEISPSSAGPGVAMRDPFSAVAEPEPRTHPSKLIPPSTVPPADPPSEPATKPSDRRKAMAKALLSETAESGGGTKGKTTPTDIGALAAIAEDAELSHIPAPDLRDGPDGPVHIKMVREVAKKRRPAVKAAVEAISRAQTVSLCFVLDTTGSMGSHIDGVRDQIRAIVTGVRDAHCKIAGLAFVGYKDWCDGADSQQAHCESFPFVGPINAGDGNVERFVSFVDKITATGGGDAPEDVNGGLCQALKLEWPEDSGTRIIFHIGDAPPHGKMGGSGQQYHDFPDSFENGHPRDMPLDKLFGTMRVKDILYCFGRINSHCDRMLEIFKAAYGGKIQVFDTSSASKIAESVTASVMASVSLKSGLAMTEESSSLRPLTLDETKPAWDTLPKYSATVMRYEVPETIEEIRSDATLKQTKQTCTLQRAPQPFARGGVRLACFGQQHCSTTHDSGHVRLNLGEDVVLKEFMRPGKNLDLERFRYQVDVDCQAVASKLARDFNNQLGSTSTPGRWAIKYLVAKVACINIDEKTQKFMAIEKEYPPGSEWLKFTNNWDMKATGRDAEFNEMIELLVAFTHFTWEHTKHFCMVTDLQGIVISDSDHGAGRPTILLTDPAIHCPGDLRFGKTNMQDKGVAAFFETHECNQYCRALGLRPGRPCTSR